MESTRLNNGITPFFNTVSAGKENTEITTKDTFMEQVESYTTFKIASFIDTYWFPVLLPIGFLGNTLSFLVMTKPNNRKMSTCIYMATISINDNLMMGLLSYHALVVVVFKNNEYHPMECKIIDFLGLFTLQNSTFQIVAMTVDKYIAIKRPHREATYSTARRAKMITVGLSLCTLCYNGPHLFLSRVIGGQCIAYSMDKILTRVYSWISFVLNAIIPFTLLIHMNYVIVKTVRKSRKMFRENDTTTGTAKNKGMEARQKSMKIAEKQLTIMLLLVTTLFLILLCPTYIRFIYLSFIQMDTPLKYANFMFFFQISFKLYATNSGINFLLYCISGKKFRSDLKEILCSGSFLNRSATRRKDGSESNTTEISTVRPSR